MNAREWFAHLRPMVLRRRPIIGHREDGTNLYGQPTFRNAVVLNESTGKLEHI